jgi:hypothetical protein
MQCDISRCKACNSTRKVMVQELQSAESEKRTCEQSVIIILMQSDTIDAPRYNSMQKVMEQALQSVYSDRTISVVIYTY